MPYLDYAATTPLDPRVFEAMLPHLRRDSWGNPSSPHAEGRSARHAVDESRKTIADLLGVASHEVIFVSSGSEGNCLALFGRCDAWMQKHHQPGHIILLSIEHQCSMKTGERLQEQGWKVTLLPVEKSGIVVLPALQRALTDDTALVSIQWANSEIGTVQPIEEIALICREAGVPYHCDAVQAISVLPLPQEIPDLLTITAHKFYGPKGIGALIVRDHVDVRPQIIGGGQEFGLRAGTENTPGIVGMAEALRIAMEEREEEVKRLTNLRDGFVREILRLPGASLNGDRLRRLPGNVNIRFKGRSGETLVIALDLQGICASTGSACATGAAEPSHVLRALGATPKEAKESVRFSLGRWTTEQELRTVIGVLRKILDVKLAVM